VYDISGGGWSNWVAGWAGSDDTMSYLLKRDVGNRDTQISCGCNMQIFRAHAVTIASDACRHPVSRQRSVCFRVVRM